MAKAHHSSKNVANNKNIAVIEYVENGLTKTKLFESKKSNGVSLHSEDLAAIWIKEKKIDPNNVKRLYSEFHPCVVCDRKRAKVFSKCRGPILMAVHEWAG